jgi:hypothetical protein
MSIARVWVERGVVAEWLGMWWVHAALATVAVVLLAREDRPPALRSEVWVMCC